MHAHEWAGLKIDRDAWCDGGKNLNCSDISNMLKLEGECIVKIGRESKPFPGLLLEMENKLDKRITDIIIY